MNATTPKPSQPPARQLYYGDNLAVLRESIASESVDLVYLDAGGAFKRAAREQAKQDRLF